MYVRRERPTGTHSAARNGPRFGRSANNYFVIDPVSSHGNSAAESSDSPVTRESSSIASSAQCTNGALNPGLPLISSLGIWQVKVTNHKPGELKISAVSPPTFSAELISYIGKVRLTPVDQDWVGGARDHIICFECEFCLVFFWTLKLDCFELDKHDYHALREYTLKIFDFGYLRILDYLRNIVLDPNDKPRHVENEINFCKLKGFQFDLLNSCLQSHGRFIFNEKRIVGKRVLAFLTMHLLQNNNCKKIVIISAKKNTHHWKELICQWGGRLTKRNIVLYKKDSKIGNWHKKDVIILNDGIAEDFLSRTSQAFIKGSNFILDRNLEELEKIVNCIKDFAFRVCFISQSVNKLKQSEKIALLNLFEPHQFDADRETSEFSVLNENRTFNLLSMSTQILQKYYIQLDETKHYPEFDFKVHEQAFIINFDQAQIDSIKALKNLVANGAPADIIKTYKKTFDKTDEDIRKMAKNLRGQFKDKDTYFFKHGLESMKRAIDFCCAKLFAETKIPQAQLIIEGLIRDGNKKIVIWAFHCSILSELVHFLKTSGAAKGYPVLEITSSMLDERRTEIANRWNRLEKGVFIIPFSVKKDRFKNLDFDAFLFVELTYNLEHFQSARNILFSPYLTKDKKLYIIVSPPADNYIWIKFETLYKKPDWEAYTRELKEAQKQYLVHDLVVKDEKVSSVMADLTQMHMGLMASNERLAHSISKGHKDKAKEQRDRRRAARKSTSHEIDEVIHALADGAVLAPGDELLLAELFANPPVKVRGHLYRRTLSAHSQTRLAELLSRSPNLDLLEVSEPLRLTLKRVRTQGETAFHRIFHERLELVDALDPRVRLLEDDFDVELCGEQHVHMLAALGDSDPQQQTRVDYARVEQEMGCQIEIKDITQCSRSAATQSRFEPEEDGEFYEEMMNMLLATYYAATKHKGLDPYFDCADYEFQKQAGLEYNFERMLLDGMHAISADGNFDIIFDMVDLTLGSPALKELVKENFKLKVDEMADDPRPVYARLDLIDKLGRCVRREAEAATGLAAEMVGRHWDRPTVVQPRRSGSQSAVRLTDTPMRRLATLRDKDTPERLSATGEHTKDESGVFDDSLFDVQSAGGARLGLAPFGSDFNIAHDLDANTNLGGLESPVRVFGTPCFPESLRHSLTRRSRSHEGEDMLELLGKRKSGERGGRFGGFAGYDDCFD